MTFTELEKKLNKLNINPASYRINLGGVDNAYCIQFDGKTTEVFYSERGIKFDLEKHDHVDEAMEDFLQRIIKDQTTRLDFEGTIK